jgi:hypothetical protein
MCSRGNSLYTEAISPTAEWIILLDALSYFCAKRHKIYPLRLDAHALFKPTVSSFLTSFRALRPSTICRGVSSLFPTSYHPILSTSSLLAATHTTPILLSAGSGSRLLPTLRHRGSKVPGKLTSSLDEKRAVNEEIQ